MANCLKALLFKVEGLAIEMELLFTQSIFNLQDSNTDSLSKKSEISLSSNKSDDSTPEIAECEPVQLRNKPARITERSSVNQCINELSNLAAEAARRRCNSEIVQRPDVNQETNGNGNNTLTLLGVNLY